jgi:hypothetical protein
MALEESDEFLLARFPCGHGQRHLGAACPDSCPPRMRLEATDTSGASLEVSIYGYRERSLFTKLPCRSAV